MPFSPPQAAATLRDIARTERASATAFLYRVAAPHLVLWGLIWIFGYGGSYLRPEWAVWWPALALLGCAASFVLSWRQRRRAAAPAGVGARYGATVGALVLFIVALFAVMPPTGAQAAAAFPLMVALAYGLVGIWSRAPRFWITGAVVAALTLAGYFWLPQVFLLWMAAVAGGSLVLGGLWMRSL